MLGVAADLGGTRAAGHCLRDRAEGLGSHEQMAG